MKKHPGAPIGADRLAVAAAALAWAPIGFVLGGFIAGRALGAAAVEGGTIAAAALLGAVVTAALMAVVATRLPAKPLRVATVVAGGVSFAVVVFLVHGFVADRIRQSEAQDAAYAAMTPLQIRIAATDRHRRPFSKLTFDSTTLSYAAHRPGGWLCRGSGKREHALAFARGLPAATANLPPGCAAIISWRHGNAGGEPAALADSMARFDHEACASAALLLVADALVEGTERRASCRRAAQGAARSSVLRLPLAQPGVLRRPESTTDQRPQVGEHLPVAAAERPGVEAPREQGD